MLKRRTQVLQRMCFLRLDYNRPTRYVRLFSRLPETQPLVNGKVKMTWGKHK